MVMDQTGGGFRMDGGQGVDQQEGKPANGNRAGQEDRGRLGQEISVAMFQRYFKEFCVFNEASLFIEHQWSIALKAHRLPAGIERLCV